MKRCRICKEEKPLTEYFKHKSTRDGFVHECKPCINAVARKYRRKSPEMNMLARARRRARDKGLDFTITIDDIRIPDVCPVLDLPLYIGDGKKCDNSPALDRIDSKKGYTPDNILIISNRANELKKDATLLELQRIAKFYEQFKF